MRVGINQIGWYALRHRDGWWLGNSQGVACYGELETAKAALTIAWQRDGGVKCNFHIAVYGGEELKETGEYTPKLSAHDAISDYERN